MNERPSKDMLGLQRPEFAQGDRNVVRKVIDLECLLPPDEQGRPRQYHEQASHRIGYGDPELLEPRPGYGFANYQNIFPQARKPIGQRRRARESPPASRSRKFVGESWIARAPRCRCWGASTTTCWPTW